MEAVIRKALEKDPLDNDGRPSFNLLQNHVSSKASPAYFIFDVLILNGHDVMGETLEQRRGLLEKNILPRLVEPICYSPELKASLADLIRSAEYEGLEGLVAKRRKSRYEPGKRSGAWRKMRISRGQEFVVGGYTPSASNFDALIFGYYSNGKLQYVARTRNGFTPTTRYQIYKRLKPGDSAMSVCKPARSEVWQMGRTVNSGEDEGVQMGKAGPRRAVRVHGMDA